MQNRGHLNFTDSHKMATKIGCQRTDLHLDVFKFYINYSHSTSFFIYISVLLEAV